MATVIPSTTITDNVRLSHLAALDVKGADAEKFLQGQTSAQVSLADGEFAPLTCFCTPKGRMLANGQLLRLNAEHFRLILSTSLVASLAAHLNKFAAFYRAELVHNTEVTFIGASDNASSLATSLNVTLPENFLRSECKQPYKRYPCAWGNAPLAILCIRCVFSKRGRR